jgi:hypothetical protein
MGFFEMADRADVFVMLDDAQYVRREWINRNRIHNAATNEYLWLSVPTRRAPQETPINEIEVFWGNGWPERMLQTLRHTYARAPHHAGCFSELEAILDSKPERLVDLNLAVIRWIYRRLGLGDNLRLASEFGAKSVRDDKLADICELLGADIYLANSGSKSYIDPAKFLGRGVGFVFQDYQHPAYSRGDNDFVPFLSTLDVLCWHGAAAGDHVLRGRDGDWMDRVTYRADH